MKLLNLMFLFIAIQLSVMIFDQHMIVHDNPNYHLSIGNQFANTNYSSASSNASFYTVANASDLGTNTSGAIGVLFPTINTYNSMSVWALGDFFFGGLSGNAFIVFIMLILVYVFTFGLFASRNEMVYLSPVAMILVGVAFLPLYNIYLLVTREVGVYACTVGQYCWLSDIMAYIIVIPLAFAWVFSVIEWWSARSTA